MRWLGQPDLIPRPALIFFAISLMTVTAVGLWIASQPGRRPPPPVRTANSTPQPSQPGVMAMQPLAIDLRQPMRFGFQLDPPPIRKLPAGISAKTPVLIGPLRPLVLPRSVRARMPITVWSGPERTAASIDQLPAGSEFAVLDARGARLKVQATDEDGQPTEAWINVAAVQPTSGTDPSGIPDSPFTTQDEFLDAIAASAARLPADLQLPASILAAQAALESGWGRSTLARLDNNYFGLKALEGIGPAGVRWYRTGEGGGGRVTSSVDPFRVYGSLDESIRDYVTFVRAQPRYAKAVENRNDPAEYAQQLQNSGYSTDPAYARKLLAVLHSSQLARFDQH